MHKAFKWLTPIITIGVAIFIVVFLIKINPSENTQLDKLQTTNMKIQDGEPQSMWLNHFSKSEQNGYFYPVNEIYINLDLNEQAGLIKTYQLDAPISDSYKLFCLQEVLKQYNVRYFLNKNQEDAKLLIYLDDKSKLDLLVKALKTYDISANILPYKEEKQWKKVQ
jgi:hypothetical protein